MVVQALLATGQTGAATDGLDWLVAKQQADGGFGDEGDQFALPENSNSTGLAAQALRVGGRDDAADDAVGYLLKLQVGCPGAAAQRGAIAYDGTGFDPSTAVRATAQAILGLAGVSLDTLSTAGGNATVPTLDCATASPTATASASGLAGSADPGGSAGVGASVDPVSSSGSATSDPPSTTAAPAVGGGTTLPRTGRSLTAVLAVGAGSVIVGAALLLLVRRRRTVLDD